MGRGPLEGAVHVPLHDLFRRIGDVPAGEVWVHCRSGYRSSIAASLLAAAGRRVVSVDDEFDHAARAGLPLVGALRLGPAGEPAGRVRSSRPPPVSDACRPAGAGVGRGRSAAGGCPRAGHARGARHVPLGQLAARLAELPADRTIVTVCRSGVLAGSRITSRLNNRQLTIAFTVLLVLVAGYTTATSLPL